MAHFSDLGTVTQITSGSHIRAVGWLSSTQPFPTGTSDPTFVKKLREMCVLWQLGLDALQWPVAGGEHTCEFCGVFHASGNLAVPGEGLLFVAPEMIAHYVTEHGYAPPAPFIEAVLRSPLPGTLEYATAVQPMRAPG